MRSVRFHFASTFRYIRFGLALAILPMLRLLFQLDFENFLIALRQDALILAAMALISLPMWWVSRCSFGEEGLEVRSGFWFVKRQHWPADQIAVLEISRPPYYRLLGASAVTVYGVAGFSPRKRRLVLARADAQALCDRLLPVPGQVEARYELHGIRRVWMALLSANIVSTVLIIFFSYRQLQDLLGAEGRLQTLIVSGFYTLEQWFEVLLPAGAAVLLALLTLLAVVTLLYSFFHTFGFKIERRGGLLVEQCGLWTRTHRRIRLDQVLWCDVRHTPFSRLLRHYPMYIAAGGYQGGDVPLLLCRNEADPAIRRLLPAYTPPGPMPQGIRRVKSFWVMIWLPGALFLLFGLLYLTASRVLPGILPLLALPLVLCAGSVLVNAEAYFTEGALAAPGGRGVLASYSRFFTRHSLCFLTADLSLKVRETPVGAKTGRATLHIYTPARQRFRIRGVGRYTARHMRFSH